MASTHDTIIRAEGSLPVIISRFKVRRLLFRTLDLKNRQIEITMRGSENNCSTTENAWPFFSNARLLKAFVLFYREKQTGGYPQAHTFKWRSAAEPPTCTFWRGVNRNKICQGCIATKNNSLAGLRWSLAPATFQSWPNTEQSKKDFSSGKSLPYLPS